MCGANEHKGSLVVIQIDTCNWIFAMQWVVCNNISIYDASCFVWVCPCCEWGPQELNLMAKRIQLVTCDGRFEGDVRFIKYPRGHWCG
jgi:hypothetical protein